jgi:hypothetical protein
MNKLNLIFGFVNKFQNQIERIDFDINSNEEKQIAGIIQLNQNANLKEMRNYLIKQKINSLFDYWEIDKERLFIEME